MEIIDAHAHIYPDKIADKATKAIGDFYGLNMEMTGTAERLVEEGKVAGVSRFVVHSCATKAHQVRSINEFIKAEMDIHTEFIGFMTLHQDMREEEISEEVDWCIKNGFMGVKLHPDFQKFYIDGDNARKFYRVIGDRLPILLHTGDDRYEYSRPHRLAKIAAEFPKVNFIAAHFGGYRCWDEVEVYKGLDNVYFDTCSALAFIGPERAKKLIDMLGAERFFFGTDFPMWNAEKEKERFMQIPLGDSERENIFAGNVKRLLKIKNV